jgi:hypothetical protein
MTESAWQSSTEVWSMLEFLRSQGHVSPRKLRLFACACVRRVWHFVRDERLQKAVELAENYADGRVSWWTLYIANKRALKAAKAARQTQAPPWIENFESATFAAYYAGLAVEKAAFAACYTSVTDGGIASWHASLCAMSVAADYALQIAGPESEENFASIHNSAQAREGMEQASLLRCIFGNPFHPLPRIDNAWLSWNEGLATMLASAIYQERAFERMPILADALEEGGCDLNELIDHLRTPSPHSRGCWVLDVLLGK